MESIFRITFNFTLKICVFLGYSSLLRQRIGTEKRLSNVDRLYFSNLVCWWLCWTQFAFNEVMKLLLTVRRSRCNNKHEQLDTLTEWPSVSCFWRLFVLGAESWMLQSKQIYLYFLKARLSWNISISVFNLLSYLNESLHLLLVYTVVQTSIS